MARRCEITGKGGQGGHHVSHANNKTKRRSTPNLHDTSLLSVAHGALATLRVAVKAIRTIEHNGGLDAYLRSTPDVEQPADAARLKRRIEKAAERAAA